MHKWFAMLLFVQWNHELQVVSTLTRHRLHFYSAQNRLHNMHEIIWTELLLVSHVCIANMSLCPTFNCCGCSSSSSTVAAEVIKAICIYYRSKQASHTHIHTHVDVQVVAKVLISIQVLVTIYFRFFTDLATPKCVAYENGTTPSIGILK